MKPLHLIFLLALAAILYASFVLSRMSDNWSFGYGSVYREQTLYERSIP
ncbi:hypothetical protein [Zavarzinella formosa]|nr:hypothetical protein [Zavarzinella formosa]